ncbi:hypothetical protein F5Y19DRAFT_198706 [Xylariaceae sp. FL1651]|nr:hypothetical protein F5Y19DRAFT_198706 [Xylariaceae sp. FL1651]
MHSRYITYGCLGRCLRLLLRMYLEAFDSMQPTRPGPNPGYKTGTNTPWAQAYKPITKVTPRSWLQDNTILAAVDGPFLGEYADDLQRNNEPAYPVNFREWRLEQEEDVVNWFNTEVVNMALTAWARYPRLLQYSQTKPLRNERISEVVDMVLSFTHKGVRVPVAIGECKRNILVPAE